MRSTFMYSSLADVAALTGEPSYVNAIDRIWENVASKKLYITGGIGATGRPNKMEATCMIGHI